MNQDLLTQLQRATDPAELAQLLDLYHLNLDTIQALKDEAAQFHFTEPERALEIAELAHRLSKLMPAPASSLGEWTLANALTHAERYVEAAELFGKARQEYLALGHMLDAARMGVGHVFVLGYTGQGEVGLALAKEIELILAASAQTNLADLKRLNGLLNNVGVLYEVHGDYEEALALYERQMVIATQLNNQHLLAQLQHNRAYALVQIGAFQEALALYVQAEGLFQSVNANADLARLYMNLSNLFVLLSRAEDAKRVQEKAQFLLETLEGMGQARHRLTILRVQFYVQNHSAIEPTLLRSLEQAQQAFAEQGPVLEEGLTWVLLGRGYLQQGDLATAQYNFAQAQKLVHQGADRLLEYRVLSGLAQIAQAQQQFEEAIQYYARAIDQVESIRHELHIEIFRAGFLTDKLDLYRNLTDLYLQLGQPALAFQVCERAKSRLITEKLVFRLNAEITQAANTEDAETNALVLELTALLQQLDTLYNQVKQEQLHTDITDALQPRTITIIEACERAVQTLVQKIQRRQPLFSALATGQIITLEQLQLHLHDAIFLQYHLVDEQICAFVVDETGIRKHVKLARLAQVDEARTAFTAAVERILELSVHFGPERAARHLPALIGDANKQLQALYYYLLQPILADLPTKAPLIVAPDGVLHYIPFHALYDGQTYLVEQRVVSYVPSATVLDLCLQRNVAKEGVLCFGYDDARLDAVTLELQKVAQLFPDAKVFSGQAATTTTFLSQAPHRRIVHLAAHATFRTDNPMLSAITLADRRLTLAEIARLRIDADIVVLSGCETGHGQMRGADLLSLAGGFLGAGARTLLVSLWRVEDIATTHLMETFYQALLSGQGYAAALRTAQLTLLQQGRQTTGRDSLYQHPAFWAPFTLIGNWRN